MVAVAARLGDETGGVGAGARLGQAVAGEMLHGAELRQEASTRLLAAEGVDHPGRHVVDRDIGGGRGTALRQLLEDDGGVEPAERRAADVFLHINAAEAERGRLAQRLDREGLGLVPIPRERHHLVAGKLPRGGLEGALLFAEFEIHCPAPSLPLSKCRPWAATGTRPGPTSGLRSYPGSEPRSD